MARPRRGPAIRGRRPHTSRQATEGRAPAELVRYLARGLVDDPEGVSVDEVDTHGGTSLELRVSMADLGKVIGKSGRTAEAMRTLVDLSVGTEGQYTLDIQD